MEKEQSILFRQKVNQKIKDRVCLPENGFADLL